MLTDTQKNVYDQIYENINQLSKDVTLCTQLDTDGIKNVMTAVYNDHPELFWVDTSYSFGYTSKGTVISVTLQYNSTADSLQTSRTAFLNAAGKIINGASSYASDLDKEKYVYKALQNLATYDENADLNQSAYSALVNGKSVCAGYSRAFQYIMMQLNVPCYFCSGYANGGYHAWNIISIDGKYYNADLSWDDSLGELSNTVSYSYFNISDTTISVDHTRRELSVNLPKCS
jgi:transglutaminase/protease-like cytokinesis protein 3